MRKTRKKGRIFYYSFGIVKSIGVGKKGRIFPDSEGVGGNIRKRTGFPRLACFFPLPLRGRGNKILPFLPISGPFFLWKKGEFFPLPGKEKSKIAQKIACDFLSDHGFV